MIHIKSAIIKSTNGMVVFSPLVHFTSSKNQVKCNQMQVAIYFHWNKCSHGNYNCFFLFFLDSLLTKLEKRNGNRRESKCRIKKSRKLKDDTNYQLRMLSLVFIAGILIIDTAHKYLIVFFLQLWDFGIDLPYSKLLWIFVFGFLVFR